MRARSVLLAAALVATVSAQPGAVRRSTNIDALLAFPSFYQMRPVLIVGTLSQAANGDFIASDGASSIHVVVKGNAPDGLNEVRGDFWDLGRMNPDDPRLGGIDVRSTFHVDPEGTWPRPGQVTAIVSATVTPAAPASAATLRNIVLYPSRFAGEKVTITGQFAGRNLLGELPDAPAKSRYDFVVRTADAAVWVTNLRPRGKDFELSLDTRIDTGRWLEVTGTVQQGRGMKWLDGSQGTLALTKPPAERPIEEPVRVAIAPPPEVLFSAPTKDETDVALSTNVRIQFSRDIDQATLKGHVHVTADGRDVSDFTTQYTAPNRELEIRFAQPLDRLQRVAVTLDSDVLGTDKQPLKAWTLNFTTH